MWSRLIKSNFPPYLCSFLAGVFASSAVNLFTGIVLTQTAMGTRQNMAMILSIVFFMTASAAAAILAWCLDDAHLRWTREGSPTDPLHIERMLKPVRIRLNAILLAASGAIVAGVVSLCLAILARY